MYDILSTVSPVDAFLRFLTASLKCPEKHFGLSYHVSSYEK